MNIIFVCLGNICRSPMAEFVMKDMANRAGLSDYCNIISRATSDEEEGNPMHYGTRKILDKYSIFCYNVSVSYFQERITNL